MWRKEGRKDILRMGYTWKGPVAYEEWLVWRS